MNDHRVMIWKSDGGWRMYELQYYSERDATEKVRELEDAMLDLQRMKDNGYRINVPDYKFKIDKLSLKAVQHREKQKKQVEDLGKDWDNTFHTIETGIVQRGDKE